MKLSWSWASGTRILKKTHLTDTNFDIWASIDKQWNNFAFFLVLSFLFNLRASLSLSLSFFFSHSFLKAISFFRRRLQLFFFYLFDCNFSISIRVVFLFVHFAVGWYWYTQINSFVEYTQLILFLETSVNDDKLQ